MSSMRDLLEKMNQFAGEKVGQKPGDQVRGSEPMPRKGGGKKHPYAGRLVGANESSENLLKELNTVINSDPVKRDLFQEWAEFKEGFEDTVKSAADKIAAVGSATRDALGTAINSIPRPFDEKEVAKDIEQRQAAQSSTKTAWRNTDKKMQEDNAWEQEPTTVDVEMLRPINVPKSKLDYNDPDVQFFHKFKDGRKEEVPKGSPHYNEYWRDVTGREDPMTQELIRGIKNPRQPGPEYKMSDTDNVQDVKVPGQDKGRYRAPLPNWKETDPTISEWGAAGTAVGPGNDDADPVELAAQRAQQVAGKTDQRNQVMGLIGQVNGARSELANLNKQFPQGANPVEKAMSLQQQQAQKVQLSRQIEDLMSQVAALRSQA